MILHNINPLLTVRLTQLKYHETYSNITQKHIELKNQRFLDTLKHSLKHKNKVFRLLRSVFSGADSIEHGARASSPLLQMAGQGGGTVSIRTANKKLTKLYWPSRKRSPKRLIVLAEQKSGGARPKIFLSLCSALRRTCAPNFKFNRGPLSVSEWTQSSSLSLSLSSITRLPENKTCRLALQLCKTDSLKTFKHVCGSIKWYFHAGIGSLNWWYSFRSCVLKFVG